MNITGAPEDLRRRSTTAPPSVIAGLPIRYRLVWLLIVLSVAFVYLCLTKSGWAQLEWKHDLDGYYDLLGRAFLSGRLELPIEPRPELLALKDPWDPHFNVPYRVLDLALYNRRYYLYHGAAPALLMFAPFRLVTGHDLPESLAVFVLCLCGFAVLCELLILGLGSVSTDVPIWMFALFFLTLGFGESISYLLQRAVFYEVALASGFLFVTCGFFCLFKSLASAKRRVSWLFMCGLCFGLATGCRPHLLLAALPSLVIVVRSGRERRGFRAFLSREVLAFTAPAAVCCLCIGAYNYARFGNPLEFGLRYLMANVHYQHIRPAVINMVPSLYYFLFCTPTVDPVFPFARLAYRIPFESLGYHLPNRYFNEGTGGMVVLCPVILLSLAPLVFRNTRRHPAILPVWALTAYSLISIVFIASLALVSQRYEIDFQPYLVLAACIFMGLTITLMPANKRIWVGLGFTSLMVWSIVANMALAVQGPYDQFVQAHPQAYFRLAQWFSPVERFRPLLNPQLHVYGFFYFSPPCSPGAQPLISIGDFASRYVVSEVCEKGNSLRIASSWGDARFPQTVVADVPLDRAGFKRVDVEFSPQDRNLSVRWSGRVILRHPVPFLFTARSQIRVGWDTPFGRQTEFYGRVIVPLTPKL